MTTIFEWILSIFKKSEAGNECNDEEIQEYLGRYANQNGFGDLYKKYNQACENIKSLKKRIAEKVEKENNKAAGQLRDELSLETKKWQKLNKEFKAYVAKHKNKD